MSAEWRSSRSSTLLITRPDGQQAAFENACRELGLRTCHWPCLRIESVECSQSHLELSHVPPLVLFTSVNAVRYAHRIQPLPWPDSQALAIGKATANALRTHAQPMLRDPLPPYSSESFLTQISDLRPSSLLIIKGKGGRDLIRRTLLDRGWQVRGADVYQRTLPAVTEASKAALFNTHSSFDLISVGSNETLVNLMALTQGYHARLLNSQLVVNSERCSKLAKQYGFEKSALVATPAGDDGQLTCMANWLKRPTRDK